MRRDARNGMILYFIILILLGIAAFMYMSRGNNATSNKYNIKMFEQDLADGDITGIKVAQNTEVPTGYVEVTLKNKTVAGFYVSDVKEIETMYKESASTATFQMYDVPKSSSFWTYLPLIIMVVCLFIFLFSLLGRAMAARGGDAGPHSGASFGKSRAKIAEEKDIKIRFTDVAGLKEEKEELAEVVDFLKSPAKYTKLGARIPKGILLVGPPGTGKTLLAKAIAGEAHVPFFSISGSDFVEMYVGVGASRVRDLFAEAKSHAPCIIFIDEIDAVARRRGSGLGGGHDEREQTLNQMLVEMDGFGVNEGIIVMAATNRVDILDPAILRPGRFDRKVMVDRPDVRGREEILEVHTKHKPLSDDVDLHEIARTTAGFAGADLENLMNEAAIAAAKEDRAFLNKADVDRAFIKVGIGTEKKSRLVPEKEKRITAYHEAGHAILFHLLPDVGPVHVVSAIPTGQGAAGYTMPLPENDNVFLTKGKMLQEIKVDFGGRIAEELIFGDITTGASQDIKQATNLARSMVVKYGMSEELGLVNYEVDDSEEVFLGRDLGHAKSYGENIQAKIDQEVKRIIDECYADAKRIIEEHMHVLHRCAELLVEKERINRAEFEALFEES